MKRIGLALSDPLGSMARPLPTHRNRGLEGLVQALRALVEEYDVEQVVIGLPLNMDGSSGPAARTVMDVAAHLERELGLPVETFDERLSSVDANARLAETGMHWKERKRHVDQVAAAMILQGWLDARRAKPGAPRPPPSPPP